jgi:predicted amino acid dehydrogenase
MSDDKGRFAMIGPPSDVEHLYAILDWYRKRSKRFSSTTTLLKLLEWLPPFKSAEFDHLVSACGRETSGFLVVCPVLSEMVSSMEGESAFREHLLKRIYESCRMAAENGGRIAALGAFTSIAMIGREELLSTETGIAVTSGNSLTSWLTVRGIERAASSVGIELSEARVAVVGASGDIGRGVCQWLSRRVAGLTLSARRLGPLEEFATQLRREGTAVVGVTSDNGEAVSAADIVVTVAISTVPVIRGDDVRPGTVVCDVGYPKNVGEELESREDVLAFSGGYAKLPFALDFGHEMKLPAQDILYGCLSEAIVLSLDGRYECFSKGRGEITQEKMEEIGNAALRHGLDVAPFYVGRRLVSREAIERVAEARRVRSAWPDGGNRGLSN